MIFVALSEAADRGELILRDGGLCRWYRRKDGVVVIREILVLPDHRRRGIAREMIEKVILQNPGRTLRARCPVKYDSGNAFWKAMGLSLVSEQKGINLWEK